MELQARVNELERPKGFAVHGYVAKVLQPNEVVRFKGRLHWAVYLNPLGWVFVSLGSLALGVFVTRVDVAGTWVGFGSDLGR